MYPGLSHGELNAFLRFEPLSKIGFNVCDRILRCLSGLEQQREVGGDTVRGVAGLLRTEVDVGEDVGLQGRDFRAGAAPHISFF